MWTVEKFEPSDMRKISHVPVDHSGWLLNADRKINLFFQFSSIGVSAEAAEKIVTAMVAGLNAAEG